jgi:hypothetical protein
MDEFKRINDVFYEKMKSLHKYLCHDKHDDGLALNSAVSTYNLHKYKKDMAIINTKLIYLESQYKSIKCVKCSKIVKEYEYNLSLINRLRSKIKINDSNSTKYDLITFVNNILNEDDAGDKIPLTDIQNRYKTLTKINITQDEMKIKLQDHFVIVNWHNKLYLSKK